MKKITFVLTLMLTLSLFAFSSEAKSPPEQSDQIAFEISQIEAVSPVFSEFSKPEVGITDNSEKTFEASGESIMEMRQIFYNDMYGISHRRTEDTWRANLSIIFEPDFYVDKFDNRNLLLHRIRGADPILTKHK